MTFSAPRSVVALLLVLVAFSAAPAFGYVIFLKDGNQISAQDKYRVEGSQAIFVQESGVTGSIPLAEIDVERTERENRVALRGVTTILGLEKVDLANATPPPPKRDSLTDILRRKGEGGSLTLPEPRRRPEDSAVAPTADQPAEEATPPIPRTKAGYVDLVRSVRRPFSDAPVREALGGLLDARGLEVVGIYEGTAPSQPFIEVIAGTESGVFEALGGAAGALLEIRGSHPDQVDAVELLILTRVGGDGRGGQFQLTPELAELLDSGELSPSVFFLRYVEF